MSTPILANPELAITKTDEGRTEVGLGDEFTYTFAVSNSGTQDATGVLVEDVLPVEYDFVAASDDGTYASETRTVTYPAFSLAVGQEATRTLTVRFNPVEEIPVGLEEVSNTVTVADDGSNGLETTLTDNRSEDVNLVAGEPNLELSLDAGETTVETGQGVLYTLTTTNSGNQATAGVELEMTVPTGMTVDYANSSAGWICTPDTGAGSVCRLNLGEVGTGAENAIESRLALTVDEVSNVDTIAVVFTVTDDGQSGVETPGGNTVEDVKNIVGNPDLAITKSDDQVTSQPGETLTYTLTVQNLGDIVLTGITTVDTLPEFSEFVTADGGGVFDQTTRTVTWSGLDLLPGESAQYTLETRLIDALPELVEELTNTVTVSDDQTHGVEAEALLGDNEAVDTNILVAEPDLSIAVLAATELAYPGEEVEYELTYENTGDQDATGVTVTFEIPKFTRGLPTREATTLAPLDFNTGWDCPSLDPGAVCTYLVGDLAVGETGRVPYTVIVDTELNAEEPVLLTNVAIFDDGANGSEVRFDNNASALNIPIPFANLVIEKTTGQSDYLFGERILYLITYENQGPDAATQVRITDLLPPALTYLSSTLNGVEFAPEVNEVSGRTEVVFTLDSVAPNERGQIVVATEVRENLARNIVNEINVASREAELSTVNNVAAAEITQVVVPTLDQAGQPVLLRTGLRMSRQSLAYLLFLLVWVLVGEYLATRNGFR